MVVLPKINFDDLIPKLVNFIAEEVNRTGSQRAVLGLSGGLDSAVVAALAASALGKKNVTGILMPSETSNPKSLEEALEVAETTGIDRLTVNITPVVSAFEKNNMANPDVSRRGRIGNITARIRMATLFDFSAANRAIVLGTSNKSEILLGYFTIFGDGASAINPLGNIYKTDIFELGRRLNLPKNVVEKAPSADLFEGQTDEKEIGYSYREMDPVIYGLNDLSLSPEEIVAQGHSKDLVLFLNKRIKSMSYKTKIPIVAKV